LYKPLSASAWISWRDAGPDAAVVMAHSSIVTRDEREDNAKPYSSQAL
jgi:hypothetical protein